jgi:hypothetical protein
MTNNICFFRFGNIEYILYLVGYDTITPLIVNKIDYIRRKTNFLRHNAVSVRANGYSTLHVRSLSRG